MGWKSPILEEFRSKFEILSTRNLLCRKIVTSCPFPQLFKPTTTPLMASVYTFAER